MIQTVKQHNQMNIPFRLSRIENRQFALLADIAENPNINVETSFAFSIAQNQSSIRCIGNFVYIQNGEKKVIMEVACHFIIKPEGWDIMCHDKKMIVPKGLLQHFATIVVGTARGILFAKSEGTKLQGYFLPLVDLTQGITDDMEYPVSANVSLSE